MAISLGAALLGAAGLGALGQATAKKPNMPRFQPINQQAAQENAIAANLASFGKAGELARKTTEFDQETLDSANLRADPEYRQRITRASGVIGDFLAGRIPLSDQNVLMRRSAEGSQRGGIPGSRFAQATTARNLGVTQTQLMQTGLGAFNQFSSNLRNNYTVRPMSVAESYISPTNYIGNEITQRQAQHANAMQRAQNDAYYSFGSRFSRFSSQAGGMLAGAAIGGAFGPASAGGAGGSGAFGATGGVPLAPSATQLPAGYAGPNLPY